MIIKYILPIIALGSVIAIHELGHLLIAKLFKVKVEVFSIGIGKKLLKIDFKGTEYALSLIPLGGYCKLKGGDIQNPLTDSDSIDMTHPLKRALIFFAGPFFNLLLTYFLLSLILMLPVHQRIPPTVLPVVGKNLPAEQSGIVKGDEIISINGQKIYDFKDIATNINSDILNVTVQRDNQIVNIVINPQKIDGRSFIGVYPYIPLKVLGDTNHKLKQGDMIIKVNENLVDNYFNLMGIINSQPEFQISYIRDDLEYNIPYTINELNEISFTATFSYNFFQAIIVGIKDTKHMFTNIVSLFIDLFKSGEVTKNISSPLRLVYEVGNSVDNIYRNSNLLITIHSFFTIMASISLTLGFINLFPIPVLDGGQILINTITAFKGSPISRTFIYAYQTAGIVIVLLLFTLGISNDIFFFGDL